MYLIEKETSNAQPLNNIGFALSLATGKLCPNTYWDKKSHRVKFLLRSLIFPLQTSRLLSLLAGLPYYRELLQSQNNIPIKVHRPYLYRALTVKQRTDVIINHYTFLGEMQNFQMSNALTSLEDKCIYTLKGKDGVEFAICGSTAKRAEREGESTVFLKMGDTLLASITFSVASHNQQQSIFIGGVQGASKGVGNEVIKQATKLCYGLFPKRILMEVIFQFARENNIDKIFGVSDNSHVFRSLRYVFSKRSQFHASYNNFWQAIGGQKVSKHLYALPLSIPRKDNSELPSKKRSEYRKRYELLDQLNFGLYTQDNSSCRQAAIEGIPMSLRR
ncbi:VirK/YbjX family protein [Gibbsiella quercinecans]|uniref:VirK/YbjX family protein n=1 Tax=Gibbsiella quercinecans TaxID=929813 RepID=UPI002430F103|nr:VirK/YbjX family protein [Gibbsiella quercinecans]